MSSAMPKFVLELENVSKTYEGSSRPALDNVSLSVKPGEFFSILGPSGSGKTTILRLVAGFERPDAGSIMMDGNVVNSIPPFKRDVRTVFQSYALFPHLTVRENVEYPLRMHGVAKSERIKKAEATLELMEMAQYGGRLPHQLSGGQRQRAALARSIVSKPRILLLDEPLAALDLRLRQQMQHTLAALQKELGIAFIYVTHDQGEALSMSDRVVILNEGHISQLSTPRDIYFAPKNEFVSRFVGRSNLIPVSFKPRGADFIAVIQGIEFPQLTAKQGGEARMGIRYEAVRISPGVDLVEPDGRLSGVVEDVLFMGTSCEINVRCGDLHLIGVVPATRDMALSVGDAVCITFDLQNAQLFNVL